MLKPYQLKRLFEKLTKDYVFHNEAIRIIEPFYKNKVTAQDTLYRLVENGTVKKFDPADYGMNCPGVYNKHDILGYLEKKNED